MLFVTFPLQFSMNFLEFKMLFRICFLDNKTEITKIKTNNAKEGPSNSAKDGLKRKSYVIENRIHRNTMSNGHSA